jgi:hypothetical protein
MVGITPRPPMTPTRVTLSLWAFSRQGATGVPLSQHGILWQARGEPQYLETFRAGADPGSILSHLGLCTPRPRDRDLGRLDLGMDSGSRITGGGSGYAAHLAHAGGVLYGTELGSVTLKRVGLFCFPIKHSTHCMQLGGRRDLFCGDSDMQFIQGHLWIINLI